MSVCCPSASDSSNPSSDVRSSFRGPLKGLCRLLVALAFLVTLGCGAEFQSSASLDEALADARSTAPSEGMAADFASESELSLVARGEPGKRFATTRKIIYTADIDLVVNNFADFEKQVPGLIESHGGFVAERQTDRQHGDHRAGRWIIRVPVAQYDAFLAGITGLGFARSRSETSDDVTEAYVDLQARISNKKKLEERILEMLDERPGKLTDLMEMERELSRVREEIERMEGRMRVLNDQTSLATVKLDVSEELTYTPPTAPTLGDRVATAWIGSTGSLRALGSSLVIAAVAIVPWAVMMIPLVVVAWTLRNRFRGRNQLEAVAN